MAGSPLELAPQRHLSHSRRIRFPTRRRRGGLVAATFRLFTSPAAAFLISFPTIGYYTLATYVNAFDPEGSFGAIVVRAFSCALLVFAWLLVPATVRRGFRSLLIPATAFICIYSWRLLENILFQGMEIMPGNTLVLLTFFVSSIIPAFMLASTERAIHDEDMVKLLSIFAVLFIIGMTLNTEALMTTAERRMTLDKINPISLAYVASSLMLFYLLAFARSKRLKIEALAIVPILLLVVSLARSRGMMISTGLTLLIYVLMLRGTRRISVLSGLAAAVAAIGFYANPEYVGHAVEALKRIDINTDMSTADRVLLFQGAWSQFLANPFIGRYAVELQFNFYPHNIYLESLMSVGLIGTVPFIIHLGMALRASVGLIRERTNSFTRVFMALLFIRDAIGAAASGAIWGVPGFWISSFLVIAMWYGRKRDERLLRVESRHQIPPYRL
jgi:hypothetical protein